MSRPLSYLRPVPFFCALFATTTVLHAQATVPTFSGPAFSSTVEELRTASAAVPPDHAIAAQILLEEGIYIVAADGTLSHQFRVIFRVDSQDAVANWSEISEDWDPWFEKPAQLNARVLQADGHFVELDQKTITDAPVKAEDVETFSSEHVRRAPLPGVAVGSIVEEVETLDEKTPYFIGGGIYRFYFRGGSPIAHVRLTVDTPSTLPFKDSISFLPNLSVTREEKDGRRHVVYDQGPQPPEYNSDIDLYTNTPNTPLVEFATGSSWANVASTYASLADPQTIPAETQSILPADLPTERTARIAAIVAKLHQEVRYTGVEFGASRLTPQKPSDVIQRHYGDCKDKATLLVAMLRAAGIPANLALLSTGPGRDVQPTLPGMSQFNHAIVYVPAAGKEKAVWIDATAQYFQPGTIPFEDSGRMALIISPQTTALTRTPDPTQQASSLVETRVFTLSQFGPSHVVESSETHGIVDANYRASYGGTDEAKVQSELENYAESAYYAKKLNKVTHGDPDDLSQPFHLSLDIEGARRGTTALDEAEVVIFPNIVTDNLPRWFKTAPAVLGPDSSEDLKQRLQRGEQARTTNYVFRPFLDERRVRIVVPAGFTPRSLPPEKTTQLGQATLTETYSSAEPGIVTATLHFDSGPGTLTAEQALAMRSAILDFGKRDYIGIYFDQTAAKAFAEGKIRTALDTDRALIAAHPSEALNHVRLARLLLQAGIGDEAHAEALRATQLDPKSSTAFSNYGWTLQHDSLGVRFGKGYDLPGAIAAYKQSIVLDPEDNDPQYDLAILYEFDARGIRYSPQSNLPEAIATYRKLLDRNKDKDASTLTGYQDNLLYALFFDKQFSDLDTMLAKLPFNNAHAALTIASAAAQHGAAAGIAAADKGNVAAADRNKNLHTAGNLLAQMRLYPEAAAILQAGIGGGDDAAQTARQIEMYKSLKSASIAPLPATDPASPVQALTFGIMSGSLTRSQAANTLARQAYTSDASLNRDVDKNLISAGFLHQMAAKSDLTELTLFDLIAGNMTFTASGDDASGHPVISQEPGSDPTHFFVVREDGTYRIVADDGDFAPVGVAVLYALDHNNPKLAKGLLDWKRDLTHKQGEDDAFAGPLLPRFWTIDSSKPDANSPAAMRLAAFSLLAGSMDSAPYLAEIAADREKASGQRQTDLDLLLAEAATGAEQPTFAIPAAQRLLDQEPDSLTALTLLGAAYAEQNDSKAWLAMLAPRLVKKPKDHDLLEQQSRAYQVAKNYPAARVSMQGVLDSGKATGNDYNSYAWLGLFDDHIGDDALKAAQQATMISKNSSFADLHTLACIFAAEGRTTEARQVLDQAMTAGNQSEPNSAVWYALGLIYEQYGATTAALTAYRKVQAHEFDAHTYIDPSSTYLLAQTRIASLTAPGK